MAVGEIVGKSAKVGDGVGSKAWVAVGASAPVADGVGLRVGEAVGANAPGGDGCGVVVQRTPRESANNINIIAESLFMTVVNWRRTLS